MNSIKTKSNDYKLMNGKAVAGVVMTPGVGCWEVVVAWEWPDQARQGFFALIELKMDLNPLPMELIIDYVADYGVDVTHLQRCRDLFPNLF